jgi:hypothetical protein
MGGNSEIRSPIPIIYCDIVTRLNGSEWMSAIDESGVRITKEIRRSATETQLDGTLKEIGNSSGYRREV